MFKMKILAGAVALSCAATNVHALVADGLFEGATEGYTDIFTTLYNDGQEGYLALGTDAGTGNQFIYFAAPLTHVDNTYGDQSSAGWSTSKDGTHTLDKLYGSDRAFFTLNTTNGDLDIEVDYIAGNAKNSADSTIFYSGGVKDASSPDNIHGVDQKNDGKVNSGDASVIMEIATSLEWNLNNTAGDYTVNSPDLLSGSADANKWIVEVGYELEFAAGTFDTNAFESGDVLALFTEINGDINFSLHASPPMTGDNDTPPLDPTDPFTPVTPNPPVAVPEPGTLALFGLGLAGLALRRRKSKSL